MKDFRKGNAFDLMRKQIEKEITKLSKLRENGRRRMENDCKEIIILKQAHLVKLVAY